VPASKRAGWVLTKLLDMFETSSSLRWLGGGCLRSRALSGKASAIREATLMFARSINSSTSLLASLCTAEEQKTFLSSNLCQSVGLSAKRSDAFAAAPS